LHVETLVDLIRQVAYKLIVTLGYFKWQNVIHADLKPENVLISTKSTQDVTSAWWAELCHEWVKTLMVFKGLVNPISSP
jgi:serine/threonine protein kinase